MTVSSSQTKSRSGGVSISRLLSVDQWNHEREKISMTVKRRYMKVEIEAGGYWMKRSHHSMMNDQC